MSIDEKIKEIDEMIIELKRKEANVKKAKEEQNEPNKKEKEEAVEKESWLETYWSPICFTIAIWVSCANVGGGHPLIALGLPAILFYRAWAASSPTAVVIR